MEEHQFNSMIEQLINIEHNTRKEEKKEEKKEELPPFSDFLDEALKQIQEEFFVKLQSKTGWGRNEVKDLFRESIRNVRTPNTLEKPPWQR